MPSQKYIYKNTQTTYLIRFTFPFYKTQHSSLTDKDLGKHSQVKTFSFKTRFFPAPIAWKNIETLSNIFCKPIFKHMGDKILKTSKSGQKCSTFHQLLSLMFTIVFMFVCFVVFFLVSLCAFRLTENCFTTLEAITV